MMALALLAAACRDATHEDGRTAAMTEWVERVAPARQASKGPPPLVVLLHGIGADENDLFPLARALDPRCTVVSLRAPHPYVAGYAWFQIDFRRGGEIVPDVAQARGALAELIAWLTQAPARLGTDPERTYLLGFSQGAMMSLGVLGAAPERLAGVIALSGRFPATLFETPAAPEAIAHVPVLVAHGTYDDVLPVANGHATRDALAPRVRDFTYREFPVAHGISDEELRLVAEWLTARLTR